VCLLGNNSLPDGLCINEKPSKEGFSIVLKIEEKNFHKKASLFQYPFYKSIVISIFEHPIELGTRVIKIEKGERYWNFGFALFSILFIGFLFDFNYLITFDPPLEFFSIITNPLTAIFYLGASLIAFRHSYMLMRFVAQKTPQLSFPFAIIFAVVTLGTSILIYLSFGFDTSVLTYPFEWYIMVSLEFVVLFWLLMIDILLVRNLIQLTKK